MGAGSGPSAGLPPAVRLSVAAVARRTADPAVLDALPVLRPATALLVGGPGWARADLPRRVTLADGLPEAGGPRGPGAGGMSSRRGCGPTVSLRR